MASFIFEDGSQADATAFTPGPGNEIIFRSATPTTLGVNFIPSHGFVNDIVELTFGNQSLQFSPSQLSGADLNFLNAPGSHLYLGSDTVADTFAVDGANASAAYGFDDADTITLDGKGGHVVDAGSGDDHVSAILGGTAEGAYVVQGGVGDDTLDLSDASGNLHVYGNTLAVGAVTAPDTDNDTITLGSGSSYANGEAGDDTITVANSTADSANRINGGSGDDDITGGIGNDAINGNKGDDTIHGNGGNDVLHGGQGDDAIYAGATGNSQLFGDLGDDVLHAGGGINVLTGGDGADTFDFTAAGAGTPGSVDTAGYFSEITDFVAGTDSIDLNSIVSGTTDAHILLQSDATFTTEAAAQSYAQGLLSGHSAAVGTHDVALIQVGTDTYLFSHESGAGSNIDTVVKLDGVTATDVKASDFV